MAINYNDRTGVLGIDLTPQDDSFQTAGLFGFGKSDEEKTLEQIQDLRKQENQIKGLGEGAIELKQNELQNIQNQIENLKKQYPNDSSIQSASLPSNRYTAMAISNYNDLFGPKTFTDALGTTRTLSGLDKPNINTAPFNVKEGIMSQVPTSSSFDTSLGVANEEKKSNGIMDMVMSFLVPGYNFIKNSGGQPYERYTPGGTIRDGIYSIDGVNVPVSSFGGDFYNPRTGLNRFDRARQRYEQTGKVTDLFASSRTGKEFFEKMRERKAQKQKALEDAAAAKRKFQTYTSGGGDRDPGPGPSPAKTSQGVTSAQHAAFRM